jgi:hypothetical protein
MSVDTFVSLFPFKVFNLFNNFHKIWHEYSTILDQTNMISFNFLQSVINIYGLASQYWDYATFRTIGASNPEKEKRFFSSPNYPR